jgi:transcriptional regulator with XRE-family HTH domain
MSDETQRERLSSLLIQFSAKENLTQHKLARRLKVSQPSVQGWINQASYPSEENRRKIAQALQMTYEELMAHLENRQLTPQRSLDSVLQEIRLMAAEDFAQVARVVCDRLIQEVQPPLRKRH